MQWLRGGSPSSSLIYLQIGVSTDGTRVLVSDYNNSRVLVWSTFPTASGAAASVVLGQSSFSGHSAGSASSNTLKYPGSATTDGTHVIVQDSGNNRVLIWNTIPTTPGIAANIVLGQPNFTATGSGHSATNMYTNCDGYGEPGYIDVHGGHIYLNDTCNNRIVIWNTIPTAFSSNSSVISREYRAGPAQYDSFRRQ